MKHLTGQDRLRYKIPLVGDSDVGKTSIVHRYTTDKYEPNGPATVGVSTVNISVKLDKETVDLSVWDTAGQEKFRSLVPLYTRNSSLVLIVFDVTNATSFKGVDSWMSKLRGEMDVKCPIFLCANKIDLNYVVPVETIQKYAHGYDYEVFFTSAVSGDGIEELFRCMAKKVAGDLQQPTVEHTPQLVEKEKKSCC